LTQANEPGSPQKTAKEINAHIVASEQYFAFFGIPLPSLNWSTWLPKKGCLITQWYIFVELRKKHPAARIINIVVGRPGTTMPTIPTPVNTIPMDNQNILSTGECPILRIFFFSIKVGS